VACDLGGGHVDEHLDGDEAAERSDRRNVPEQHRLLERGHQDNRYDDDGLEHHHRPHRTLRREAAECSDSDRADASSTTTGGWLGDASHDQQTGDRQCGAEQDRKAERCLAHHQRPGDGHPREAGHQQAVQTSETWFEFIGAVERLERVVEQRAVDTGVGGVGDTEGGVGAQYQQTSAKAEEEESGDAGDAPTSRMRLRPKRSARMPEGTSTSSTVADQTASNSSTWPTVIPCSSIRSTTQTPSPSQNQHDHHHQLSMRRLRSIECWSAGARVVRARQTCGA
jgi:hypothetical protein